MWVGGLLFALVTAFAVGFVFVAPGAVYIHGNYIKNSENGKISLAGPATNIILALLFLSIPMFFPNSLLVEYRYSWSNCKQLFSIFQFNTIQHAGRS